LASRPRGSDGHGGGLARVMRWSRCGGIGMGVPGERWANVAPSRPSVYRPPPLPVAGGRGAPDHFTRGRCAKDELASGTAAPVPLRPLLAVTPRACPSWVSRGSSSVRERPGRIEGHSWVPVVRPGVREAAGDPRDVVAYGPPTST
jgi:hypothetical protein